MNPPASRATEQPPAKGKLANRRDRFFYSGAAALLLTLTFIGFHHFYLEGRNSEGHELDPARRGKLIVHGIVMSLWILIFMAQPLLIVSGKRKVHKILGWVGAVVALCVVVLGLWMINPPPPAGGTGNLFYSLTPRQFNGFIHSTVILFAAFVMIGVWNRRRPAVHRPMMFLSVLAVEPAAFDRIPWVYTLYFESVWGFMFGPAFGPLVVGLFLLGVKCWLSRSLDRWFAIGLAGLAGAFAFVMVFVRTSAWDAVANLLSR